MDADILLWYKTGFVVVTDLKDLLHGKKEKSLLNAEKAAPNRNFYFRLFFIIFDSSQYSMTPLTPQKR
jgi:hypothetical protein